MSKQAKPETSRLNLFYILHVLEQYTDEEHPLSAMEIADKVNKEFSYLSSSEKIISDDTVKRILDELVDKIFPTGIDCDKVKRKYGYYLFCVMQKEDTYVTYRITEGKQAPKKFYYIEDDLKLAELLTLKHAIETYSYFSEEDITEVVRKLVQLRPRSFPKRNYIDVAGEDRDENSLVLMNIDALNDIIMRRNCARIVYCAYDIHKKLVPRSGYPRVVEPIHLMWSNGYYYLLAYSTKYNNIVSYRVDRITDVEEVEVENTHRVDEFNSVKYRYEHPVMFGGEKEGIVVLCKDTGSNHIMNIIMDTFGKKARVNKASTAVVEKYLGHSVTYYEKQGITWLELSVEAAPKGVELWVTQYCNDCFIVSPEESVLRVKHRLSRGIEFYNN